MPKRILDPNCNHGRCPVNTTLEVIGGKWKPIIIYHLENRTLRFNEIRRLIPAITQRMLTLQLRDLEEDGIINRKIYTEIPPKVEYTLTNFGETLIPIIHAMYDWGKKYRSYYEELEKKRLEEQAKEACPLLANKHQLSSDNTRFIND